MSFDLQKVLESKRAHHRALAALPIGEKLRMLDALRERELAIRALAPCADSSTRWNSDHFPPDPAASGGTTNPTRRK